MTETAGELYDSIPPGGSVHRRAHGITWEISRPEIPAAGFGSPDDYTTSHPPEHGRHWCHWCLECLHCDGAKPCPYGTDGMHYWPPREGLAS